MQITVDEDSRVLQNLEDVAMVVGHLKGLGCRVVLTSGSFDLLHLGHVKYLERAKELADVLIVGVDSDEKIRERKGRDRPLVPEDERVALLGYQRPVDFLYLKVIDDPRWGLIHAVEPDVLVLTADHSYSDEQLEAISQYVGSIDILPRQSTVTTSERIRQMYMNLSDRLGSKLAEALPSLIESVLKKG